MTETNYERYTELKEKVKKNIATYNIDLFPGYYSSKALFNGSTLFTDAIWPPETPSDYEDNTRGKLFYGIFDVRYYCTWNTQNVSLPAFTSTNITAILEDKDGTPLKNMNVSYMFNQQDSVNATTDNTGKITIPYTATTAGKQVLTFTFEGTKEYIPTSKTITITVTKLTPTLKVENVQVYVGNTTTVSATLLQGTTPLVNKTVDITVQNETYTLTTDGNGSVTTPSFENNTVGTYTILAEYTPNTKTVGGLKDSDNYKSTSKTATLTVLSQESCTLNITKISSATYGSSINIVLTLKDKNNTGISGAKPILKVNNTRVTVPNATDSNGITSIPYTVNNTGKLDIYSNFSTSKYALVTASISVPIIGIPTLLKEYTRTSDDGNDPLVILTDKTTGDVLENQTIKFYDGSTLLDTVTTDNNGIARGNGAFLSIGTHTIKAEFSGTSVYASSNTTFTLNATFLVDTCNDLRSWDVVLENFYASDGSSKFGLDVNDLFNLEENKWRCRDYDKVTSTTYKRNCRRVNDIAKSKGGYKHLLLRDYCDDLKTESYSDNGLHAPTGVILRSKYLKTTENCTIQFKLTYSYNYINEKTSGKEAVPREFGGHLGLMEASATTAEKAPVRLEVYRRNSYCIIEGGNLESNKFAYSFLENVEYTIQMKITSTKVTITILELGNSAEYTIINKAFTGLYPYIFAFTNGTELIIREMKIIPN